MKQQPVAHHTSAGPARLPTAWPLSTRVVVDCSTTAAMRAAACPAGLLPAAPLGGDTSSNRLPAVRGLQGAVGAHPNAFQISLFGVRPSPSPAPAAAKNQTHDMALKNQHGSSMEAAPKHSSTPGRRKPMAANTQKAAQPAAQPAATAISRHRRTPCPSLPRHPSHRQRTRGRSRAQTGTPRAPPPLWHTR